MKKSLVMIVLFFITTPSFASSMSFSFRFKTLFINNPADPNDFRTSSSFFWSHDANQAPIVGQMGQHFSIIEGKISRDIIYLCGLRFLIETSLDYADFPSFDIITFDGHFGLFS